MHRASRASKSRPLQLALSRYVSQQRRRLSVQKSVELKHVNTSVRPLDENTDSISKFRQEAFEPSTPLLITPDPSTRLAVRDGLTDILAQQRSSYFLTATTWFTVHETDQNSADKPFYTVRTEGDLKKQGGMILPYELVVSKEDEEFATGLWRVQNFRQYLQNMERAETRGIEPTIAQKAQRLSAQLPIIGFEQALTGKVQFHQFNAALRLLFEANDMAYQNWTTPHTRQIIPDSGEPMTGLYIAQVQIADLPQQLRDTLSAPAIVLKAGKGDVYDSNIWLGMAPTYTPLHKDPNHNYFAQIAGDKVVRLFPPHVGLDIFRKVQLKIGSNGSAAVRGEEMMQGPERQALHDAVWYCPEGTEGFDANLTTGDALFIPKGWWHSIKSLGTGVNMSVNWWFR